MTGERGTGSRPGGPGPAHRTAFRAPSGVAALVVAGIVVVLLLVDTGLRAGWLDILLIAPWLFLVLWLIYAASYASHIAVDDEGATVQNFLRVVRLPWQTVTDIDLRYQVRFTLRSGRIVSSFGGPMVGRPPRPALRGEPEGNHRQSAALRDLDLIRGRWERAAESGAGHGEPSRSWDAVGLVSLTSIVVWALGAVIISRAVA
ncbi:hypothetical protein AB3M83_07130 [Microbacterium sp. 179-B 1A2 NHS]|uniref:hypothetical protein n=1 Tax=Microbacterium sp. 179-B 1A2 NHS TaxID=3142383 RepID=UPI00399FB4B2